MAFVLTSAAFADNGAIPKRYTCEDADVSPPLNWSDAPPGAKSFALIVDDPDAPDPRAPKMTWVHWVIENIPADTLSLPEGAAQRGLPAGAVHGLNDWKPATVALAHRSAGIGIFTSSTHSTRLSPVSTTRRKRSF
jgi:Raf kinase inhibitor-like YbhB/YbcL family protein